MQHKHISNNSHPFAPGEVEDLDHWEKLLRAMVIRSSPRPSKAYREKIKVEWNSWVKTHGTRKSDGWCGLYADRAFTILFNWSVESTLIENAVNSGCSYEEAISQLDDLLKAFLRRSNAYVKKPTSSWGRGQEGKAIVLNAAYSNELQEQSFNLNWDLLPLAAEASFLGCINMTKAKNINKIPTLRDLFLLRIIVAKANDTTMEAALSTIRNVVNQEVKVLDEIQADELRATATEQQVIEAWEWMDNFRIRCGWAEANKQILVKR